jgi:putative ABC transport system permease protein
VSVLAQDVRYALRSLARAPGFTLVALITLALGIGGTTAIFSVVDGILLRPLPYPDAAQIVGVSTASPNAESGGSFTAADYLDYARDAQSFSALAGYRALPVDVTGRGDPVRLMALETTAAFFGVFELPPLAGRMYSERIDPPSGPRVAVLSEDAWRTNFGGASDVVGSVVRLNGIPTTILGVAPRALRHPNAPDVWMLAPNVVPTVPLAIQGDPLTNREVNYFQAVARLKPGVSVTTARADLRVIAARMQQASPDTNEQEFATVVPLQEVLVGDVRIALLVILGAVGFVLLIACANVASLTLARGTGRRRELAVRSALGASRRRLLGQLLTESVVLALAGGVVGLLVAYWGVYLLLAIAPESIPRIREVGLDLRVAAFGAVISAAVGVFFGLMPALQGTRGRVVDALKDGGRTGTSRTGARSVLVVAEIALSLMLLIGAGLMLTSFTRLRAVDPGFVVKSLVVVGVSLPQTRYSTPAQVRFYQQLHERVVTNGVTERAALVFPAPFSGMNAAGGYQVEGAPERARADRSVAQLSSVSPGYFQTMGIALLKGRDLSFAEKPDSAPAIVINRALAEREWPGQDPIGKRLVMGSGGDDPNSRLTVVGMVADSRRGDLAAQPDPAIYFALTQFTLPFMSVVVRTEAGESATADAVRAAVRSIDSELPIDDVETVERVLERVTGQPRFRALLVAAFAAVALVLAAVGLYGLISFTVAQRVPEIGVRLALGATPAQVLQLVIGHGIRLAAVGVALGLAGAFGVARVLEGLLFSISATDPVVYASLALLLLSIAALACYIPARRAMRIDPMIALRAE